MELHDVVIEGQVRPLQRLGQGLALELRHRRRGLDRQEHLIPHVGDHHAYGETLRHRAHATSTALSSGSVERNRSDRKSTRLNSSHPSISYAVFCLKKKKKNNM